MNSLKNKRVAVFGLGVSGLSAVKFLKSQKIETIAINGGDFNLWPAKSGVLNYLKQEECFSESDPQLGERLKEIDLVILSPGIPREHNLLGPLLSRGVEVWGELELAYRFLEERNELSPIIGITGTNGKTTSTTFLGEIIRLDHKKVFVGGNIGVPFCDYAYELWTGGKKADFILLELSSFQLESIFSFKVNVALILNLFQNHGERYADIKDYGRSKFHITNRFTKDDVLIYPENFEFIKAWAINEPGKKIAINTDSPKIDFDLKNYKLPGIHNRVNLAFIIKAALEIGITPDAIAEGIASFRGVHHRIEYVDGVKGLDGFKVFNDAKSTNWDATVTAVVAMEDFRLPISLIIGGKKRGHGDSVLPHLEFFIRHVKDLYLIGEMAEEIEGEIRGKIAYTRSNTLEEVLKEMRTKESGSKGVLLFSPAFPSFDQFQNYEKRGEHFVALVQGKITL